ncbi:MAG: ATP-binding cassette domain-containing protein [Dehalococcoidia bacterium]|nr:ATP-binding cassette domain-containing protein [Dehalococcoidia bacterium]
MPHPPVELVGASLAAPGGRTIAGPISLAAKGGELLLVIGASGAGKTSLLELIAGLKRPAAGSVRLFGEQMTDPARLPLAARRRVAYLFQSPERMFFRPTLRDEFEAALQERALGPVEQERRMVAALSAVGLAASVLQAPHASLSGGQQRLAAIALAVALGPDLLVLDEPTSGLDRAHAALVLALLEQVRAGGTALVVATHDLDRFVPAADRVVCLADGLVVADAPPSVALADPLRLVEARVPLPFAARAAHSLGLDTPPLAIDDLAATIAAEDFVPAPRIPLRPAPFPNSEPSGVRKARLPGLPLVPAVLSSLLLGIAFLLPAWLPLLAVYLALLAGLGVLWGLTPGTLLRRMTPVFALGGMAAGLHLLAPGGDWSRPLAAPPPAAWIAAARALVRVVGPVLAATVLCASMHPAVLLRDFGVLLRALPVARRLATDLPLAMALVVRLAPQLRSTVGLFDQARLAHGQVPPRGLAPRVRALIATTVPLLLVTVQRSAALGATLYLRGFADARPVQGAPQWGTFGWFCCTLALAALAAAVASAG